MVLAHLMTALALRLSVVVALPMAACQAPKREPTPTALHVDTTATTPTPGAQEPSAYSQAAASVAEQTEIAGVKLSLRGCLLTIQTDTGSEIKTIDLPEPCKLGRKSDGSVQVVNTKQGATMLVISSRPSTETAGDCDTRKRALVVDQGRVRISTKVKKSAGCGTTGPFDEPLFIVLAASVEGSG